jgi:hypothetical protein
MEGISHCLKLPEETADKYEKLSQKQLVSLLRVNSTHPSTNQNYHRFSQLVQQHYIFSTAQKAKCNLNARKRLNYFYDQLINWNSTTCFLQIKLQER